MTPASRTALLLPSLLVPGLLVSVPAQAEPATVSFTVTGVVEEPDGTPANDVQVSPLEDYAPVTTDDAGRYTIAVTTTSETELATVQLVFSDATWWSYREDVEVDGRRTAATVAVSGGHGDTVTAPTAVVNPQVTGERAPGSLTLATRRAGRQVASSLRDLRKRQRSAFRRRGCDPLTTPMRRQRATIEAVNVYRRLAGLEPVRLDTSLSEYAQAAALVMARNGTLTHSPRKSMRCWSKTARQGASRSNLAMGTVAATAVWLYMQDPGAENTSVGHRRWILTPEQDVMGTGDYGGYNALYVLGPSEDRLRQAPALTQWPGAGWFPRSEEPNGRWSLHANRWDLDLSQARVRVTIGDRTVRSRVVHRQVDGLVWQIKPKALGRSGKRRVDVSVTGVSRRGLEQPATSWTVRLFGRS